MRQYFRRFQHTVDAHNHDLNNALSAAHSHITRLSGLPRDDPLSEQMAHVTAQLSTRPVLELPPKTTPTPSLVQATHAAVYDYFNSLSWELRVALLILSNYLDVLNPRSRVVSERSLHRALSICQQATGSKPHYAPLDVLPLIQQTASLIDLGDTELRIRSSHCGALINGDPHSLARLFMNLIKNANEALQDSPRQLISIDIATFSGRLFVHVADTGCGIPPEWLNPMLIEPGVSTKSNRDIRGMGLAIAAEIVYAHHGVMDVTSKVSEGTTFALSFPLVSGR